eukprot:262903-Chlamydomonas_euryale.AAC.1
MGQRLATWVGSPCWACNSCCASLLKCGALKVWGFEVWAAEEMAAITACANNNVCAWMSST